MFALNNIIVVGPYFVLLFMFSVLFQTTRPCPLRSPHSGLAESFRCFVEIYWVGHPGYWGYCNKRWWVGDSPHPPDSFLGLGRMISLAFVKNDKT